MKARSQRNLSEAGRLATPVVQMPVRTGSTKIGAMPARFHRSRPSLVIVCDAPDFDLRLAFRRKIDQGIVNRGIAIMIGFADHAAVDCEAAVAESWRTKGSPECVQTKPLTPK